MGDSTSEVYLHFVWATKWREDSIPADLERQVYRIVKTEAHRVGCDVLAIGGMLNHIHLLVLFSRTITQARFMEQIKGTSSRFINETAPAILGDPEKHFAWQPGYGSFSVGINQTAPIIAYIENQKEHHAIGDLRPRWEKTEGEPSPTRSKSVPSQ
jgi:putative transposase